MSYIDRKAKHRYQRKSWIQRINAASREYGVRYSDLIHGLNVADIDLDRKVVIIVSIRDIFTLSRTISISFILLKNFRCKTLSNLVIHEPMTFKAIMRHILDVQPSLRKWYG